MKACGVLYGALLVLLWQCPAFAEPLSGPLHTGVQIGLGIVASFGAHELGHQIVGSATGEMRWNDKLEWQYRGKNPELVSISGFALQGIGSEVLMATTKRDNPFLVGYVGFNIINNLFYVAKTENGANDFLNFQDRSQRRLVEAAVLVHTGLLAYRLFTDKDFKAWWFGLEVADGVPMLKFSYKF